MYNPNWSKMCSVDVVVLFSTRISLGLVVVALLCIVYIIVFITKKTELICNVV